MELFAVHFHLLPEADASQVGLHEENLIKLRRLRDFSCAYWEEAFSKAQRITSPFCFTQI